MRILLLLIGVGLSIFTHAQCYPDRHSTSWNDAWYSCETSQNPNPERGESHWILYDLRHEYRLGTGKMWNINAPDRLTDGFRDFFVDYSTDGETWKTLGNFTLSQGAGHPLYEGEELFDFNADTAKYVLFTAESNYGGECFRIAEMKIQVLELSQELGSAEDGCLWSTVYPNPHDDSFNLDIGSQCPGLIRTRLFDTTGRIVFDQTFPESGVVNQSINTSNLKTGIYLLTMEQNGEVIQEKVAKLRN